MKSEPSNESGGGPGAAAFTNIKARRGFEEVAAQIRSMLRDGQLKTGDKLPQERELVAAFGVSRPIIREALRTLEMAGILELRQGAKGGAYVRDGSSEMLKQSFEDLMSLGHISLANLVDARRMIHCMILDSACEYGTSEDFDTIEQNLMMMDDLAIRGEWALRTDAGVHFLHLIAKATHNQVMVVLIDSVMAVLRHVVLDKGPTQQFRAELIPLRRRILIKLRARDSVGAVVEMKEYLKVVNEHELQVHPKT